MFKNRKIRNILSFLKQIYIYLILFAIYLPLVIIILLSFNNPTARGNIDFNFGTPTFVNYFDLFQESEFVNALLNSLLVVAIVTPITILIAVLTCFGIWRNKVTTTNSVLFVSRLTIINPEAITGISLTLLFASTWVALGFNLGFFTVVLAHISFCVPYAIMAIYPRMIKANYNLILASYDLGRSKIQTFFKITIPYLMPAILSAIAITLAMSLDDFIITSLVNGSFQTVATLIYQSRKGIKAWIVTFGALVILLTFIIIIVVSFVKYSKMKIANKKKNYLRRKET